MNVKVFLVAGALALSSQAAFAATETSCNPFARGENCNDSGGWRSSSVASPNAAFQRVSTAAPTIYAPTGASQSQGVGSVLSQLLTVSDDDDVVRVSDDDSLVSDEGEGSDVPEISVVPVPAAGFLLLAGLGGLIALRRKQ